MTLPFLDAMVPAFAAAPQPKRKLVSICTTLGIHGPAFFPEQHGRGYEPSRYLRLLDGLQNDFTVFSGLSHPDVDGGHASAASFLTAARHPGSSGFRNSISLDQYAVEKLTPDTRYASLVLASAGSYGLSWTRGGVQIPADSRASAVYAKLFLNGTPEEVSRQIRRLRDGQSIMDSVASRAKALERSLGSQDRDKLDQYFTSVRELEVRLAKSEAWANTPKPRVSMKAPVDPASRTDLIGSLRPHLDVIHLALETDSTRFVTLNLEGFNQVPTIEGVTQDWHGLSHHGKDPAKIEELALIEGAEIREVGAFLSKLKGSNAGEGSLLDETMVLYGSNLGNASNHETKNLPILLAGGGFKHGQHLAFNPEGSPPLCNLYVQMLQRLGVEAQSFATSRAASIQGFEV